jgi:nicotinate-nucleotide adenylyltransferase
VETLFGGTFDPVHVGHLIVAEHVRDALGLDRITFVPSGQPPHKPASSVTAGRHRLAMLERALAPHAGFAVAGFELEEAAASYTIHTVRRLRRQGARAVALVLGADSLVDLPTWLEPQSLLAESHLIVVARPGVDLESVPAAVLAQVCQVDAPRIDIASSTIRARVASRRSIRFLVPEAVREYIEANGLYRRSPAGDGERA